MASTTAIWSTKVVMKDTGDLGIDVLRAGNGFNVCLSCCQPHVYCIPMEHMLDVLL